MRGFWQRLNDALEFIQGVAHMGPGPTPHVGVWLGHRQHVWFVAPWAAPAPRRDNHADQQEQG